MIKLFTGATVGVAFSLCFFIPPAKPGTPVKEPAQILQNYNAFVGYMGDNLKFAEDFTGYNTSGQVITKGIFLKMLATGNYLPLRLNAAGNKLQYRLYKFNISANKDIHQCMQGWAQIFYDHYKRIGARFPGFDFTDLQGHKYNNKTIQGKIVVLQCWYIGCKTCEGEMPALNALVKNYSDRKDIIFVSLALNTKLRLNAFLKQKPLAYAVVPDQKTFISKALKVNAYPTHFIINKQGVIVNVVDTPEEVEYTLKNKI